MRQSLFVTLIHISLVLRLIEGTSPIPTSSPLCGMRRMTMHDVFRSWLRVSYRCPSPSSSLEDAFPQMVATFRGSDFLKQIMPLLLSSFPPSVSYRSTTALTWYSHILHCTGFAIRCICIILIFSSILFCRSRIFVLSLLARSLSEGRQFYGDAGGESANAPVLQ